MQALSSVLELALAQMSPAPSFSRDQDGGEDIPAAGLVVLRDGLPGEPEVLLSPLTYLYEHRAEVDVMVSGPPAERHARFDQLCRAIGAAVEADRTLGDLCDWVEPQAPEPVAVAVEGGEDIRAATLGLVLSYATASPL